MPFNLAVFDIDAAADVFEQIPSINSWYLSGHSLGGAMASSYVDGNSSHLDGLILMGAYPINEEDIRTLSIYGSEDHGINDAQLLGASDIFEIAGRNHSYFGNYGEQKGDGTAIISRTI